MCGGERAAAVALIWWVVVLSTWVVSDQVSCCKYGVAAALKHESDSNTNTVTAAAVAQATASKIGSSSSVCGLKSSSSSRNSVHASTMAAQRELVAVHST